MKRQATIIGFALIGALSVGLYALEHEVQRREQRLAGLNQQLIDGQNAIRVLRAEWSYLNRPERLQRLAAQYATELSLVPVAAAQTGRIDDLPWREVEGETVQRGHMPRPAFKPENVLGLMLASDRGRN